ncbi:MAG: RtcB family protein [Candidatus Sumerlaeota bacterium]|nr:RtcB family protein [Candidatus Sumerlaeota bacterium]
MIEEIYNPEEQRTPIKSWASDLDDGARHQLVTLSNMPYVFHHVAAMADAHVGVGATIGSVFATENAIVPSAVGVDIGCGMCALSTDVYVEELKRPKFFDAALEAIFAAIPTGFNGYNRDQPWKRAGGSGGFNYESIVPQLTKEIHDNAPKKLGTLGGGNHFIELQRDAQGKLWIMIHSGSRNIGKMMADHWMKAAKRATGRRGEAIPGDLSYLETDSDDGRGYLSDMQWALAYAFENRMQMMEKVVEILADVAARQSGVRFQADLSQVINIHHNYAAPEEHFGRRVWVHRKGATLAERETIGIIPGSMGAHSYIVRGKGAEDSFRSCSHGAGRRMSRGEARKSISFDDMNRALGATRLRAGSKDVRDEAPQAYKPIEQVLRDQQDLVEVMVDLAPLATVKG